MRKQTSALDSGVQGINWREAFGRSVQDLQKDLAAREAAFDEKYRTRVEYRKCVDDIFSSDCVGMYDMLRMDNNDLMAEVYADARQLHADYIKVTSLISCTPLALSVVDARTGAKVGNLRALLDALYGKLKLRMTLRELYDAGMIGDEQLECSCLCMRRAVECAARCSLYTYGPMFSDSKVDTAAVTDVNVIGIAALVGSSLDLRNVLTNVVRMLHLGTNREAEFEFGQCMAPFKCSLSPKTRKFDIRLLGILADMRKFSMVDESRDALLDRFIASYVK